MNDIKTEIAQLLGEYQLLNDSSQKAAMVATVYQKMRSKYTDDAIENAVIAQLQTLKNDLDTLKTDLLVS
jgi:hypothetical protein